MAAAAARDDGGPLGGVAGTLKGCGELVGKLLDRVATLRRLCDARDASLDAKEATLNAREAELGVEVERLREGEAGLLADFLPLLERKRERLAELEKEVLDRRCEHYVKRASGSQESRENYENQICLALVRRLLLLVGSVAGEHIEERGAAASTALRERCLKRCCFGVRLEAPVARGGRVGVGRRVGRRGRRRGAAGGGGGAVKTPRRRRKARRRKCGGSGAGGRRAAGSSTAVRYAKADASSVDGASPWKKRRSPSRTESAQRLPPRASASSSSRRRRRASCECARLRIDHGM